MIKMHYSRVSRELDIIRDNFPKDTIELLGNDNDALVELMELLNFLIENK